MSTAVNDEKLLPTVPVNGQAFLNKSSDVSYGDDMPRDDEPLTGTDRYSELFVRSQERSDERFMKLIEAIANGAKQKPTWPAWIAAGAAGIMLLVTISGARWTNANESMLSEKLAVLTEKLTQAETRQSEFRRDSERNYLLMDERYRQLSIALEARGIQLPNK